jgi:hypothetical protein
VAVAIRGDEENVGSWTMVFRSAIAQNAVNTSAVGCQALECNGGWYVRISGRRVFMRSMEIAVLLQMGVFRMLKRAKLHSREKLNMQSQEIPSDTPVETTW